MPPQQIVSVLDVSALDYPTRLCAASLQALLNRQGTRVFLEGKYD